MSRIRVAIVANNLEINGISSVIMNYCRYINKEQFQITIIVGGPVAQAYENECIENNIKIVKLDPRKQNPIKYYIGFAKIIKKNVFDIIHLHGSQASISLELTIALCKGILVRIAHSHNTTCKHKFIHYLLRPLLNLVCTEQYACSKEAGEWLFGKRYFEVIPNGFDTKRFIFNNENRTCYRKKMSIEDKFVIGHIGRINYQKNQEYLLKVFEELLPICENAVLILVGTGPMLGKIQNLIDHSPVKDRIILYGETNQPEVLYSVMDCFVFPSRYEGFPVTLLEAQMSGLNCIISDKITKDVIYNTNVYFASIEDHPRKWADLILDMKDVNRSYDINNELINSFDVNSCVGVLESRYYNCMNKIEDKI